MIGTADPITQALGAIGAGDGTTVAIAEAGLLLAAHDRPGLDLAPYREHLETIAAESCGNQRTVVALLFERLGYRGDRETYDDLRNADLAHVIDRRRGLPVALGILLIHGLRAAGLRAYGVNTPSHFLVETDDGRGRAICDPFDGGRMLGAADLRTLFGADSEIADGVAAGAYPPMPDRDVLLRLQNNIRTRALAAGDRDRTIRALESMVLVAPTATGAWRDLAELYADTGRLRAAMAALAHTGPAGHDALADLKRRLN